MRILLLVALAAGCSRSSPSAPPASKASPPASKSDGSRAGPEGPELKLAPPQEPGDRIVVKGRVVRAEDQTPLTKHVFRIYQANAKGDYEASNPNDERTARLSADVTTDDAGHFVIHTILPGRYGEPIGDPHLHFEFARASPQAHVVYFEGFLQESTRRWQKTTDQAHIIPLTWGAGGFWTGKLVLPVRGTARE